MHIANDTEKEVARAAWLRHSTFLSFMHSHNNFSTSMKQCEVTLDLYTTEATLLAEICLTSLQTCQACHTCERTFLSVIGVDAVYQQPQILHSLQHSRLRTGRLRPAAPAPAVIPLLWIDLTQHTSVNDKSGVCIVDSFHMCQYMFDLEMYVSHY